LVLCSPPYDFYVSRQAEMLALIEHWLAAMPAASACVVEADDRFDVSLLPRADTWRVRSYPPAVIGIYEQPALGQGAENGD
jgi:hypothetical protein